MIFLYVTTYNFNLRFPPAYICLITTILISKLHVLFTLLCRKGHSVFLMDIMGGKITINLNKLY
jgi:hypothetical protein